MLALNVFQIFRFFGEKEVLSNITFEIPHGGNLIILGPNGSGKTTLLKILTGSLLPDKGDALIYGKSIISDTNEAKKKLAWIPSRDNGLFPYMTGKENIQIIQGFLNLNEKKITQMIENWNNILPFKQALSTRFSLCSSGMKQLLLLFCSCLHSPEIFFMDEPFRNLDEKSRLYVTEVLQKQFEGKSIILSTHHYSELKNFGARTLELS